MKKQTNRERLPPLELIELFSAIQSKQMRMVIGALIKDGSSDESMKRFATSKLKFEDDDIHTWSTDNDTEDGGKQKNPKPPKNEDHGIHSLQSNDEHSEEQEITLKEEILKKKEKRPTERKGKKSSHRKDVMQSESIVQSSDDSVKTEYQSMQRSHFKIGESSADEEQDIPKKTEKAPLEKTSQKKE